MNNIIFKQKSYLNKTEQYKIPIIFFVAYKFIIDFAYIKIHDYFRIHNSVVYSLDISIYKIIFSYVLLFIIIFFMPKSLDRLSSLISHFYLCFIMIPILTVYGLNNQSTICMLMLSLGFIMQCLIITQLKNIKLKEVTNANSIITLFMFLITIIVFGYLLIKNGIPTINALNIFNVYSIRENLDINKYIYYLLTLQIYVIGPFFICLYLNKNKYFIAFVFVFLQFILYLWTAHKTILFTIPLIIVLFLITKLKKPEKIILTLLFIFVIICILLVLLVPYSDFFKMPISLFVRRVMILPAQLKFLYFDFFSNNPKLNFVGILPTWLLNIQNPYSDLPYAHLIGSIYFKAPEMNANTGYFIEGYARFGYAGFYIVFIVMGLALKLFDGFVLKSNKEMIYPLGMIFFISFNDGFLISELFIIGKMFILSIILLLYNFDFMHKKNSIIGEYEEYGK